MSAAIPFDRYCEIEAIHATSLRDLLVSPHLYHYRQQHKREDSDTFRVGRASHTAILEPDRFLRDYVLWDGKVRRGSAWDEFRTANARKTILTVRQYELALKLRDAARAHPVATALLREQGKPEVTIEWEHKRTGLRCKARIDWLCSALIDVKTCRNPDPRRFGADAARYGYAFQLAFYADGVAASLGKTPPLKIIAVQNIEPFDVAVYDVPEETQAIGREQIERAIDTLVECQRTGKWPGVAPDEMALKLPLWAAPDYDEDAPDESQPIADADF